MPLSRRSAITIAIAVIFVGGLFLLSRYAPGLRFSGESAPGGSAPPPAINETNLPLALPDGFIISIFARDLPEARVMRFDRFGNLWVSRTKEGAGTLLEITDGRGVSQFVVLIGPRKPHGR